MPLLHIDDPSKPEKSLTPAKIANQITPPPKGKKVVYWVKGIGVPAGFGLLVRPRTPQYRINATWIMQADAPNGVSRRVNIARFGEVTFADALDRAKQLRDQIIAGENPNAARRRQQAATMERETTLAFTLGEAVELYVRHLMQHGSQKRRKGRTETRVVETFRSELKPLDDWMKRPLAELKPSMMADRHELMTTKNGPRAANKAMKNIRAAWNLARGRHPELPANILAGDKHSRGFAYNEESFGGDSVPWRDLPGWWTTVHDIANPVRRDLQVFALLTGLRAGDCLSMTWADVDPLDDGNMRRPNPKGGKRKAFTVPLASYVVDLLKRRRDENKLLFGDDAGWCFPTTRTHGSGGAVTACTSMTELRYADDGSRYRLLPSPHVLRRTFGSACAAAGIGDDKKNLLLNHRPRQASVGDRYNNVDPSDLRQAIEDVVEFLLEKAGAVVPDAQRDAG
jgi:integrase